MPIDLTEVLVAAMTIGVFWLRLALPEKGRGA
jgi:hypothetical protein